MTRNATLFQAIHQFWLYLTTNLKCKLRKTIGTIEIYDAIWLKKSRGFDRDIKKGFILKSKETDVTYHLESGKNLRKGIRQLQRKIEKSEVLNTKINLAGNQVNNILSKIAKIENGEITDFDNIKVYRKNSIDAGNCVPGTNEFIHVHGLSGKKGGITLRDFCNCKTLDNVYRHEKRLTILETIKKAFFSDRLNSDQIRTLLN